MKHRVCLAVALAVAMIAALAQAADGVRRPNVVLVLMDDMGYADVGCQGATDVRTPHIDRLAREGVRLTDFYSNGPVCSPTRCGLMTGRWQQRVGLEWALGVTSQPMRKVGDRWEPGPGYRDFGLDTRETTLGRMLKSAGYATAAFGKWHLGFKPENGPNAHGFDEFFGLHGGNLDMYSHKYRDGSDDLFENTAPTKGEGYLTELIVRRAVDFVERQDGKPFFLYVPFNAVHWPFQEPGHPEQTRTYDTWYEGDRQVYAHMLEACDRGVGEILAVLEKKGVLDNTLFVFTNDNGGEVRLACNRPLFHHKATLWEGGIRVPCILRWPGHLPAGTQSKQVGISMDLAATILAATGARAPEGRTLDGMNLLPMLAGEKPPVERTLCWRINRVDRKQRAVRHGKWKYVMDGDNPVTSLGLLFDLEADVSERFNIAPQHREIVLDLQRRYMDWEKEVDRDAPELVVR